MPTLPGCPQCGRPIHAPGAQLCTACSTDRTGAYAGDATGDYVPAATLLGRTVAGYEIQEELGRGGMGVVYKARQKALGRVVALKMVRSAGLVGEEELARFRAEAQSAARLQHPNLVTVYEIGEYDGGPFFSLEYVPGGSLSRALGGNPQPPRDAAALVEVLARAMHYAHSRGVVHRDLKPANVLLMHPPTGDVDTVRKERTRTASRADSVPSASRPDADDWLRSVKITDFGLAKQLDADSGQTHTGQVMGTPGYMAPEQAAGRTREIGPAADVYALGAILYKCLTGRRSRAPASARPWNRCSAPSRCARGVWSPACRGTSTPSV